MKRTFISMRRDWCSSPCLNHVAIVSKKFHDEELLDDWNIASLYSWEFAILLTAPCANSTWQTCLCTDFCTFNRNKPEIAFSNGNHNGRPLRYQWRTKTHVSIEWTGHYLYIGVDQQRCYTELLATFFLSLPQRKPSPGFSNPVLTFIYVPTQTQVS